MTRSSCDSRTCPPRSWKSRATRWRIRLKSLQSKKALFTSIIIFIIYSWCIIYIYNIYIYIIWLWYDVAWLIHVWLGSFLILSDTYVTQNPLPTASAFAPGWASMETCPRNCCSRRSSGNWARRQRSAFDVFETLGSAPTGKIISRSMWNSLNMNMFRYFNRGFWYDLDHSGKIIVTSPACLDISRHVYDANTDFESDFATCFNCPWPFRAMRLGQQWPICANMGLGGLTSHARPIQYPNNLNEVYMVWQEQLYTVIGLS